MSHLVGLLASGHLEAEFYSISNNGAMKRCVGFANVGLGAWRLHTFSFTVHCLETLFYWRRDGRCRM